MRSNEFHRTSTTWITHEITSLALVVDLDSRLPTLVDHIEREVFNIPLEFIVIHLTTNETFGIKDSILGVGMESILGSVSNTREILTLARSG